MKTEGKYAEIIRISAEAGAKAFERERNKAVKGRKDNRLHNVDILFENYRGFKALTKNAVFSMDDIYTDDMDMMCELMWETGKPEVIAQAILSSTIRTKIIVAHIDTAIAAYSEVCKNTSPEALRRCRCLKMRYINDMPMCAEDIAAAEAVDTSTVRRDIARAKSEIMPFLFGIDAVC